MVIFRERVAAKGGRTRAGAGAGHLARLNGGMDVLRYAAFTETPEGGNPAGVVLDATGLSDAEMQRIAADVGYSETAFLLPTEMPGELGVRYFSPLAEVAFCGHATIASGVAYAREHAPGDLLLHTRNGPVPLRTRADGGTVTATLTSVPPSVAVEPPARLAELLAALHLTPGDLDPALPVRVAYAGVYHPVVALRDRETLRRLDYDYDALAALMAGEGWTTVQVVHRETPALFHARDPFPPGGVVEDPATGAAAAALGAYLRRLGLVDPPATFTIRQGEDMGRPSLITVDVPPGDDAQVSVTGTAVRLDG